ncbi:MAG: sigma-70 family RNA polymerase sigma factor [Chloroflexota bacterium]|nr:sigma-70 family RNA polymerase sigma factor [Chloroflexota bacterium]
MNNAAEKWQSGDIDAFEALFQQYQGLVFRTAYLMTGDREEAEDVLQEVWLTVWRARHTFDPTKGKLTTWLHRITVNRCVCRQRKKKPSSLSLEKATENGFDLPGIQSELLTEDIVMSRLEYETMLRAINHLNGRHRPVLVLRYFNDLSYDEIAQVLDIPLGTVKSRINQAMNKLREQLKLPGEDESC